MQKLSEYKATLGPLQTHSIQANTTDEAYYQLGVYVREAVRIMLSRVLKEPKLTQKLQQIQSTQKYLRQLQHQISVPSPIQQGLQKYHLAIKAWSQGAGISLDHAWLLQHDNAGCQTGMLRSETGSILFWHTEENLSGYVPSSTLVELTIGKQTQHFFSYPFLLPGSAFAWKQDYFQAVDFLPLEYTQGASASLANCAAWLALELCPAISFDEIRTALQPFWDGYALNQIWKDNAQVHAERYEFGGAEQIHSQVGASPGDYLFTVNRVSDPESPLSQLYSYQTAKKATPYVNRIHRSQQVLESLPSFNPEPLQKTIQSLLCSRKGGGYAYANTDVVAYCLGEMSGQEAHLSVSAGPAQAENNLTSNLLVF